MLMRMVIMGHHQIKKTIGNGTVLSFVENFNIEPSSVVQPLTIQIYSRSSGGRIGAYNKLSSKSGLSWRAYSVGIKAESGASITLGNDTAEGIRSGSKITYSNIMRSEESCLDFVLSYCKMFGLLLIKDSTTKTVSIMSRNTYFGSRNRLDYTYLIDYSKERTITPVPFNYRVGIFKYNALDSKYEKEYISQVSKEYGSLHFNNGSEFTNEKSVYIDMLFNNLVVATGYDQYYWDRNATKYKDNKSLPYLQDDSGGTISASFMPCFISGLEKIENSQYARVTDDNGLSQIYGSTWSNMSDDGITITKYPKVTKELTKLGTNYSLHFGIPAMRYSDSESHTTNQDADRTSIYARFWREYLKDIFSDEYKELTCYIFLPKNDITNDLFNKFIFINDSIWRINKIHSYNILSSESTKCTLSKVGNINAYVSQVYIEGNFTISNTNSVIYNSDTSEEQPVIRVDDDIVRITLDINSSLPWTAASEDLILNTSSGNAGISSVTITLPENTSGTSRTNIVSFTWGNNITNVSIIQLLNWTVTTSSNISPATSLVNGVSAYSASNNEIVTFTTDTTNSNYIFGYWIVNYTIYTDKTLSYQIILDTDAIAYWFDVSDIGWEYNDITVSHEAQIITNKIVTPDNNISYSITSDNKDISFNVTSGNTNQEITFNISENDTTSNVVYIIRATYNNGFTKTFTINQLAAEYLKISPETITVNGNQNTYAVEVSSNTDWSIEIDPVYDTYVSASPSSGSGNASVTLSVSTNITNQQRIGELVFKTVDGNISVDHVVTQLAGIGTPYFTLLNSSGSIIQLDSDITVNLVNSSDSIVDQYTISSIPAGETQYEFADVKIGNYTIGLSSFTGSTPLGSWNATPANDQNIEISGGDQQGVSWEFKVID